MDTTTTTTNNTTKMIPKHVVVDILVLYGSQTGNSQQAAEDFCKLCTKHLSNEQIHQLITTSNTTTNTTNTNNNNTTIQYSIETTCMSLDDFLEIYHCQWHTIHIIFVSSYGVGGPPLGCYRFRDICNYIMMIEQSQQSSSEQSPSQSPPKNIYYAICGLGDSKYTTYLQNPTIIDTVLSTYLQFQRFHYFGHADASSSNKHNTDTQSKVIEQWISSIWEPLAQLIVQVYNTDESSNTTAHHTMDELQQVQIYTIQTCYDCIPDYSIPKSFQHHIVQRQSSYLTSSSYYMFIIVLIISIGIVILAILLQQQQQQS